MLYWLHVCICLRLLVWNAGRSHVKKIPSAKEWGGTPLWYAITFLIYFDMSFDLKWRGKKTKKTLLLQEEKKGGGGEFDLRPLGIEPGQTDLEFDVSITCD